MTQSDLIVVGVDGSTYSREALKWALAEARSHQQRVLAVSTWTKPPVPSDPAYGSFPWGTTVEAGPATEEMLETVTKEVAADYPEVEVDRRVVAGKPHKS